MPVTLRQCEPRAFAEGAGDVELVGVLDRFVPDEVEGQSEDQEPDDEELGDDDRFNEREGAEGVAKQGSDRCQSGKYENTWTMGAWESGDDQTDGIERDEDLPFMPVQFAR